MEQAYELVKLADRKNCTIAVDALHLYRSGGSHNDLDKIPQQYLGEIHLCDAVINGPIDKKLVAAQRAGQLKVESTSGTPKGFEGVVREARLSLAEFIKQKSSQSFDYQGVESFLKLLSCRYARAYL